MYYYYYDGFLSWNHRDILLFLRQKELLQQRERVPQSNGEMSELLFPLEKKLKFTGDTDSVGSET